MKFIFSALLSLAVILNAGLALAYPAVGDKATFTHVNSSGSAVITFEILSIDLVKDKAVIQQTLVYNGQTSVQAREQSLNELATEERTETILTYCAGVNGISETVTVPAGTFKSCRLINQYADSVIETNVADVPWGFVRYVSTHSSGQTVMELLSYTRAK